MKKWRFVEKGLPMYELQVTDDIVNNVKRNYRKALTLANTYYDMWEHYDDYVNEIGHIVKKDDLLRFHDEILVELKVIDKLLGTNCESELELYRWWDNELSLKR